MSSTDGLGRFPRAVAPPRRVFSGPVGQPRFRRATDVVVLVGSALGLLLLVAAYPPSSFERSIVRLLASVPGWLAPLWELLDDALSLWALLLAVAVLVSRRWLLALRVLCTVAAAVAVALVATRLARGDWGDLSGQLRLRADADTFSLLRLVLSTAVVGAVNTSLVRPLQRVGRWAIGLGLMGALFVETAPPSASAAAVLASLAAGAAVRLALGTSAGRPEREDVVRALAELGVAADEVALPERQPAGVFVARARGADGRPLLVKVYGRDAYDTQVLEKAWRTVMFNDGGPPVRRTRLEAVEHEALVTLLARQAGVATRTVVAVGESSTGDAVLVLTDETERLGEPTDEQLADAWASLRALGAAGIAHHRIGTQTVALVGGRVGLVDLDRATFARSQATLSLDRAQLLAATASLVGTERAVAAALAALGRDGLGVLVPFLQDAALAPALRRALEEAGAAAETVREAAAAASGVESQDLVRLRRVTWWSAGQAALFALAAAAVIGAFGGVDLDDLRTTLSDASWGWLAAGLVAAQLPRLTQAVSTLGSVPEPLPFGPVYAMQLATGYLNLALPSNFARLAINIRFFQRQGIPPAIAVTGGAIDSLVSTVAQALLLAALLLFSLSSVELDLEVPATPSTEALVALVGVALLVLGILASIRRLRDAVRTRFAQWWPDVSRTVRGLRSGGKLALLVGGSVGTELLFATALGIFANAFGYDVGLADLLLINISVSLLASFVPVPGGIGIAELGLTVGLTAAGLTEEAALATALCYRIATFYLPPLWGFFAMQWMRRRNLL